MKTKNNQQSIQRLRELLQSGRYPKESRLPPERELSVKLGISRAALRKALSVLEAENLIWRHVGQGTFVGPRSKGKHAGRFMAAEITNPAEIMEVRLVFEPKMAAIAALRATPGNLEQMTNALLKSEAATDPVSFEVWDGALHQAIASSTGNSLLISFFEAISSLREDKLWGRLKEASFSRSRHQSYCRQHRELVQAIIDRDAAAAERQMRSHLEAVQKNLLGNL
ncbi:MAG: FCD domain-containing protein [Thermodesulfobacteriota bacterium]